MSQRRIKLGQEFTRRRTIKSALDAEIEVNQVYFNLMTKRARNNLIRSVLYRSAANWRWKHLRKRVQAKTVRRAPFNYRRGGNSPMIGARQKGDPTKLLNAMWKGRINAIATAKKASVSVSVPLGHPVIREIADTFKVLPIREIDDFTLDMIDNMNKEVRQLVLVDRTGKGRKLRKPRIELSAGQQRRINRQRGR